jgi:hypothetical protein
MNYTSHHWTLALLGVAGLLLAACGGAAPLPQPTSQPSETQPPEATQPPVTEPPSEPAATPTIPVGPRDSIAGTLAARADLAGKLHISESQISVRKIEAVDWRDSSLGCPKSGQGYLQVITPGFRIFLEAQGQTYEYHTDRSGHIAECGEGQSPAPTEDASVSDENPMVELAIAYLAKRLDISSDQIKLVSAEAVTWTDACMGIHRSGVACADVMTPGYLILLSAQNSTYEYHTDQSSRVALCETGPGTCQ